MDPQSLQFLGLPALLWIPLLPLARRAINLMLGKLLAEVRGQLRRDRRRSPARARSSAHRWCSAACSSTPERRRPMRCGRPAAITQTAWSWMEVGSFKAELAFHLDSLSAVMIMIVTFVGAWIHIYSIGYMAADKGYARYFGYLNLFTGSMLILVLAANLPVMFIGWEGVGLCSFLLDRLLVRERRVRVRRSQGVRRQSHRRLLLLARHVPACSGP